MRDGRGSSESGGRRTSLLRKCLLALLTLFILGSAAGAAGTVYFLEKLGRTPREWAPYLVRRATGHRQLITWPTALVAGVLNRMDRIPGAPAMVLPAWAGANPDAFTSGKSNPADRRRHVTGSIQALSEALGAAEPGDVIELLPGRYRIEARGFFIGRPGQPDAPITLRAARLGQVVLESAVTEAIKINAPNWRFENLVMRGLCTPEGDSYCEHAFHVVGNAKRTVIRNNLLVDFNAHIKINGEDGGFPDEGTIDHNTLTESRPRETENPVTPIDLDGASGWLMTRNLITDFIKAQGDGISYGAFAKAAGDHNIFERNVVLCEHRLFAQWGQRVGLSFGGGGSPDSIRRDRGSSGLEHDNGRMSDNLIAFCSDAGIYINRGRGSQIEHNTLLDTSGILVRFVQSSASIKANIIDGVIAVRDNATMHSIANEQASLLGLFAGLHPQRRFFVDIANLDLGWRELPPRDPTPDARPDLCGSTRPPQPAIGAFEDFATCLKPAGRTN